MRSYAASEWQVLRKVRIPNALPYFFTAMKLATTLSLIGAIVGEYFGGVAPGPRPDHRRERGARSGSTSPGRRSCSAATTGHRVLSRDRRIGARADPVARVAAGHRGTDGVRARHVRGIVPRVRMTAAAVEEAPLERGTQEEEHMKIRSVLALAATASVAFAACTSGASPSASAPALGAGLRRRHRGAGTRPRRPRRPRRRSRARSGSSSSGRRRPSSPATSPPTSRATTRPRA